MNGADGRTRVTERDKKSTGSFQNCHNVALNSFYGMGVYQNTTAGNIMMMRKSEYAPLPASLSRFTVFQRRSERQHLQLAITSRASAAFVIQPRRDPPSCPNGTRAGRPTRARAASFLTRARACPCTKFTCDPSTATAGARADNQSNVRIPPWLVGTAAGRAGRGRRGGGGPRCVRGAPGRRGVARATAANSHEQREAHLRSEMETL